MSISPAGSHPGLEGLLPTEESVPVGPLASHTTPPASLLETFRATSAKRELLRNGEVIRLGGTFAFAIEQGATITYANVQPPRPGGRAAPKFNIQLEGGMPRVTERERPMTRAEEEALLGALEKQLGDPPIPGSNDPDRTIVAEFVDKLRAALGVKPGSDLFDNVRWSSAVKLPNGNLVAEGGFGIDSVMEVAANKNGHLSYRTRMAMGPFPPSRWHSLDKAERADLASSIERHLASGVPAGERAYWKALLRDSKK